MLLYLLSNSFDRLGCLYPENCCGLGGGIAHLTHTNHPHSCVNAASSTPAGVTVCECVCVWVCVCVCGCVCVCVVWVCVCGSPVTATAANLLVLYEHCAISFFRPKPVAQSSFRTKQLAHFCAECLSCYVASNMYTKKPVLRQIVFRNGFCIQHVFFTWPASCPILPNRFGQSLLRQDVLSPRVSSIVPP